MQPQFVELNDADIAAIPRDKRIRIIQAQIDGGRAELADLYKKLETEKVQNTELEFRIRELDGSLTDERKKLQGRQRANDKLSEQLKQIRAEIGQKESRLKALGGDLQALVGRDSEVDRMANQLDKEQANVLRLQAQIEKRRNELMAIDLQYKEESEERRLELEQISFEKRKMLDLLNLELQKMGQMRQRNVSALRSVASHGLDAQLTAVLSSMT
jgi:chromosome segregation ATPase